VKAERSDHIDQTAMRRTAHTQKKGTKAVTGAVPFQKGKLLSILGANMYILGANMYILGANIEI